MQQTFSPWYKPYLSDSMLIVASGEKVDSGKGSKVQEGFYCLNLKADILPTSNSKNVTVQTAFLFINHWSCYIKSVGGNSRRRSRLSLG